VVPIAVHRCLALRLQVHHLHYHHQTWVVQLRELCTVLPFASSFPSWNQIHWQSKWTGALWGAGRTRYLDGACSRGLLDTSKQDRFAGRRLGVLGRSWLTASASRSHSRSLKWLSLKIQLGHFALWYAWSTHHRPPSSLWRRHLSADLLGALGVASQSY